MHELKSKLDKVIERMRTEIAGLRTGRATPALVEDIVVDYYGSPTPIKALASISSPGPRELVIQPWDKNALQPIERAIQAAPSGINPIADRDVIRLTIPSLTEESRKEFVKLLKRFVEDARIQVRKDRDEALKSIKGGDGSEDEIFRKKEEAQKIIDEVNKKIEEIAEAKEKELMMV